MRTVTAVPLNATVTSLLAVSPKCREGRRRRRLTCLASRRSPRRRGAAERRRAGPVDSPSKSRRFGRDKELGESAIRNSAGRRSGSRSVTTAAPRPSHEIRPIVRRRRSSAAYAMRRRIWLFGPLAARFCPSLRRTWWGQLPWRERCCVPGRCLCRRGDPAGLLHGPGWFRGPSCRPGPGDCGWRCRWWRGSGMVIMSGPGPGSWLSRVWICWTAFAQSMAVAGLVSSTWRASVV